MSGVAFEINVSGVLNVRRKNPRTHHVDVREHTHRVNVRRTLYAVQCTLEHIHTDHVNVRGHTETHRVDVRDHTRTNLRGLTHTLKYITTYASIHLCISVYAVADTYNFTSYIVCLHTMYVVRSQDVLMCRVLNVQRVE